MRARLRSWWQKIRKRVAVIAAIALIASVLVLLILTGYRVTWTGFFNKTLWDWLGLLAALAIPLVVGLGAAWFTAQQGKVSDRENADNQREAALQEYINKMSELLIHEKLRDSAEEDEVRKIARVRTLTILPRLDAYRKSSVLQFLHESGLINKGKSIIDLYGANLRGANLREAHLFGADLGEADLSGATLSRADLSLARLSRAHLIGADLSRANLREADLKEAQLQEANLREAYLGGAHLSRADLSEANLKDATKITNEELEKQAKSLSGAIMPDGSKHP